MYILDQYMRCKEDEYVPMHIYASEEELVSCFVDDDPKKLSVRAAQIAECFKLFRPEVTKEEVAEVICKIRKENY